MALNAPHPDGSGNIDFDTRAARLIMSGSHADMVTAEHDEKTGALKIEAVRDLTSKLALKPFEAKYRIAILDDFHMARPQAQDALLKTLEEPAESSVLVVIARGLDSLLPTIVSRCQHLSLRPASVDVVREMLITQYQTAPDHADLIARLSAGRVGWAIQAVQTGGESFEQRASALQMLEDLLSQNRAGRFSVADTLGGDKLALSPLLELWMSYWRDILLLLSGTGNAVVNVDHHEQLTRFAKAFTLEATFGALQATRAALTTLERTNTNARLVLEVMLLDYPYMRP